MSKCHVMGRAEHEHKYLFKNFFGKNNKFNEKSLKSSTEERRENYFRMALLKYLVEKQNFNKIFGRINV